MSLFRRRPRVPIDDLPVLTTDDWENARFRQDHELREDYGRGLLVVMIAQLVAADGLMLAYAVWGVDWKIPNTVMQTWLAATVVQVIGVVYVVVSHLFPKLKDVPRTGA
jgi:hypothetical protein